MTVHDLAAEGSEVSELVAGLGRRFADTGAHGSEGAAGGRLHGAGLDVEEGAGLRVPCHHRLTERLRMRHREAVLGLAERLSVGPVLEGARLPHLQGLQTARQNLAELLGVSPLQTREGFLQVLLALFRDDAFFVLRVAARRVRLDVSSARWRGEADERDKNGHWVCFGHGASVISGCARRV